jgi:uroporphyrinogen-III synthase
MKFAMQQNRIKILSTRPLDQMMIWMAAKKNMVIDTISFIKTKPLQSKAITTKISRLSTERHTVVFTSRNALESVASCLENQKTEWQIFCIGNITQKKAAELFGAGSIGATSDSASALADRIIADGKISSVVFFCGNRRRKELPEKLADHGIAVEEIVVYKTIQSSPRIKKTYDGILFFSPSAVNSFFSSNSADPGTVFFAIGSTTAAEIRKYRDQKIIVAPEPSKELLAKQAIHYFEAKQVHH